MYVYLFNNKHVKYITRIEKLLKVINGTNCIKIVCKFKLNIRVDKIKNSNKNLEILRYA